MKLKSFGCSFIFGTDIGDEQAILNLPNIPSQKTWPAHLARYLGYKYECLARPGSGNLQIAEQVLSHAAGADPAFFVVGWSWIDRFDYTNANIINDSIQSNYKTWQTVMPVDDSDLAKTYYKELHSEYRDKLVSLMQIKLVIDTLNQKNIPFLMTYIDNLLFDQRWNYTTAVLDLQKFVQPYMKEFNGHTFLEWSRSQGFKESKTWHPLEEAHRAGADLIIKAFDKQKTIDPIQPVHV